MIGKVRSGGEIALDGTTLDAWERALALWGVQMHDARLRPGAGRAQGAPAWFTFPPAITVDPAMVAQFGGGDEMESVFAHEIGHHVLAPSTRIDALKIRHQIARALVASGARSVDDEQVAMLSNLWTDLLVNTRVALLQNRRDGVGEPGIVRLSRALYRPSYDTRSRLWWVYLRTYERVWNLPAGALCLKRPPDVLSPQSVKTDREIPLDRVPEAQREQERALRAARADAARIAAELEGVTTTHPELDADLLAGVVRTFAADPVGGAMRFAVIAAPYLIEQGRDQGSGTSENSAGGCAADDSPATAGELGRVLADRRLHDPVPGRAGRDEASDSRHDDRAGQRLDPARTLELYSTADADAVIAAWYRAEAAPWVKPYMQRLPSRPALELPGPIESWETGDDLAELDWSATLQNGAIVVPGITTKRRSFLEDDPTPAESSIELDLYIDSSGSMTTPRAGSAAVLAGTILALSVLRGGGRLRVTSFSGPGQVAGADTFTRDPNRVLGDLAFFFGGGTSFPLDLLERRYAPLRPPRAGDRRHLVVLSDDGLTSMFGEQNEQHGQVAAATRTKLSTATLVLTRWARSIEPIASAAGYDCEFVETMEEAPAVCARLAEVLHG